MSLKFISASQGRGHCDQFHSAPDYLASVCPLTRLGFPEHEINAGTRDVSFQEKDLELPRPEPQESIYGHSVLPWRVNLDEHAFVAGHYIDSE